MSSDWDGGQLGVGDCDADGVVAGVEVGFDAQAGPSGCSGDELDDGPVGHERPASPVLGDEAEHAMLNAYLHRAQRSPCSARVLLL